MEATAVDVAKTLLASRGYPAAVIAGVESYGDSGVGAEVIRFHTRRGDKRTAYCVYEAAFQRTRMSVVAGWHSAKPQA